MDRGELTRTSIGAAMILVVLTLVVNLAYLADMRGIGHATAGGFGAAACLIGVLACANWLAFEHGRIYGIVGPNGSGKTMLLRAICGFIRPDRGHVEINGQRVEFNRRLPEPVGVVIENPGFVNSETAMQNLRYLAGINHAYDGRETQRLLRIFGLEEHSDELNRIADVLYVMGDGELRPKA